MGLSKTKVYPGILPGAEVSQDYIADRVPVARRRVAWAGYRLAVLLNVVWPANGWGTPITGTHP